MRLKPLFTVAVFAILGFALHKLFLLSFIPKAYENNFIYSAAFLYSFFTIVSLAMVFALLKISKKSLDYVGYSFLGLTSLKMVIAYILLRPILHSDLPKTSTEKISFFIIFIYFLAIETIVTIRILNNKQ